MTHLCASKTVEALLAAVTDLESQRFLHGGLPLSGWTRLRELNAELAEHLGALALREERRHDLRLPIVAKARVRWEDIPAEASCCELSKSGLFLGVAPPLREGTLLQIDSLILEREPCRLDVRAVVAWTTSETHTPAAGQPGALPAGIGVRFVDVGEDARCRIEGLFERLLDDLAASRRHQMNSERLARGEMLLLRDDLQLLAVCRALLRRAQLGCLWDKQGPTAEAKAHLRENGRALSAEERAILLSVWNLWIGTWDVHGTHLWHMDGDAQEAVIGLLVAARRGPKAVDGWLDLQMTGEGREALS